ncbi:MAG: hypothetical protein RLY93_12710 [Sumerlaeia bacterium]
MTLRSRFSRHTRRFAVATVFALTLPLTAAAQEVAVPDRVPSGVEAFVSINDTNEMWQGFGKSPVAARLGELLALNAVKNSPEFQDFLLNMDKAELELGYSLKPDQFLGEVLQGVDLYMTDNQAMVIVADFDSEEHAEAMLQHLLKQSKAAMAGQGVAEAEMVAENEVSGTKTYSLSGDGVHATRMGEILIASSSMGALSSSITSTGNTLAENERIKKAFENVGMDGHFSMFASKALIETLMAARPELAEAKSMIPDDIAAVMNFGESRIDGKSFVGVEEGSQMKSLIDNYAAQETSNFDKLAEFAANDALFATVTNLFDGETVKKSLNSPTTTPEVKQGVQQIEAMLGMKADEVLSAFGPDTGIFFNDFALMGFMPQIDLTIVAQSKNKDQAKAVMSKLESNVAQVFAQQGGGVAVTPQVQTIEGVEVRSIIAPGAMGMPLGLFHAMTEDGTVVIGPNVESLRGALKAAKAGDGGLFEGAAWSSASGNIPGEAHQYSQVNLKRIVDIASPLLAQFVGAGMQPDDMEAMFKGLDIVRGMGNIVTSKTVTEDGQHSSFSVVMQ